jgi:hypothetical protein
MYRCGESIIFPTYKSLCQTLSGASVKILSLVANMFSPLGDNYVPGLEFSCGMCPHYFTACKRIVKHLSARTCWVRIGKSEVRRPKIHRQLWWAVPELTPPLSLSHDWE